MTKENPTGSTFFTLSVVSISFIFLGIATVYFTLQRIQNFESSHDTIMRTQVVEAARDVEQFVRSRQALVETFAIEKQEKLNAFAADVSDEDLRVEISESLQRWFPTYFTFTIADITGTDLIDDVEGFVGQQCRRNIQDYVGEIDEMSVEHASYETLIHPQANNYHFDIMAPWVDGPVLKGVFFVSFRPGGLAEILNSHQSEDHFLALINRERTPLIEINAQGSRDRIAASRDINLTDEEVGEIRHARDIDSSRWRLVGYLQPGMLAEAERATWTNAAIFIALIVIAWAFSCLKIAQLSRAQESAFHALAESNRSLAEMADAQTALRLAAESGEQTKAQFLASMSHEIRTPLNAVIGLTDLVLRTDLTDYQRGYISKVSLAGRNLLGLINDVLDFSKIEAGKLEIERTEFELDPVLENVAVVVGTKAEENGSELIVSVDRAIPNRLIGDPLRVGQVLINLAGNAAKFTENGEIVVDIALVEDEGQTWLAASVRDNGVGMTDDQVSKLFQPFVQADQSVTRTHGGTGLGLSISQQLVEAMGGVIGVESEAGVGSVFHFKIPIEFAEGAEARDVFEGVDPRTVRILVVDDNETIRETLRLALENLRFKVDTAGSGEEAVERVKSARSAQPYNVLLVDWKMPGLDGVETIKLIRAVEDDSTPAPTIGMVSASDLEGINDDLTALGVEYTLQKPINTSFLIDSLMMIFDANAERRPVRSSISTGTDVAANLDGVRILLAEDNELNQMVALGLLQGGGCEVDVVTNGEDALDQLRTKGAEYYAMVLMDIQMPVMDGLSASRAIRDELKMTDLPIIAMTAHALAEERQRCFDAGMNDHISKPIDGRDVVMKVTKWADVLPASAADARAAHQGADQSGAAADFDLSAVAVRLMLPEHVVAKMLEKFCNDYADVPAKLKTHVDAGALDDAKDLAHSLKGVAGTFGVDEVQRLFSDLESQIKDGTFDPERWNHDETRATLERNIALIESALRQSGTNGKK